MKPTTKVQKEVYALYKSHNCNKPTDALVRWAEKNTIKFLAHPTRKGEMWCTHCGERFAESRKDGKTICPHCGHELTISDKRKTTFSETEYIMETDVQNGWQVVKIYLAMHDAKLNGHCYSKVVWDAESGHYVKRENDGKAWFRVVKVFDRYFNPTSHHDVVMSCGIRMFSNYCSLPYAIHNEFEIRTTHKNPYSYHQTNWYDQWFNFRKYPHGRLHPMFARMGIAPYLAKSADNYADFIDICKRISGRYASVLETIFKWGDEEIINAYIGNRESDINEHWRSLCIARKHGYKFGKKNSLTLWLDYLRDLKYLGKDLRNPSVICPQNLHKAHELTMKMAQNKREREMAESRARTQMEQMQKDTKARDEFFARIAKWLDMVIENEHLRITALPTPESIIEEGKAMHHCVGGYWNRPMSLILSAKDMNGKRVETIEISLKDYTIVQVYGFGNKPTEYHNEIISMLKDNANYIKGIGKGKTRARVA